MDRIREREGEEFLDRIKRMEKEEFTQRRNERNGGVDIGQNSQKWRGF